MAITIFPNLLDTQVCVFLQRDLTRARRLSGRLSGHQPDGSECFGSGPNERRRGTKGTEEELECLMLGTCVFALTDADGATPSHFYSVCCWGM